MASATTPTQPQIIPASASSSQFFRSPITTLCKSLDEGSSEEVSLHDLAQAYSTFSGRIKMLSDRIDDDNCAPALDSILHHAPQIAECLRRDICRALKDPFPSSHQARPGAIPDSLESTTPHFSEEELKYAQDMSYVSQHALLLSSTIFRFPALCDRFEEIHLIGIVTDVLAIVHRGSLPELLPTPNADRTFSLALWSLSTQALPYGVIHKTRSPLMMRLKEVIFVDVAVNYSEQNVIDALQAMRKLLVSYPNIFVRGLIRCTPHLLSHALSRHQTVRLAAAHALGGFVIALTFHGTDTYDHMWDYVGTLRGLVEPQMTRKRPPGSDDRRLYDLEAAIVAGDDPLEYSWLLSILGSLMILTNGAVVHLGSFLRTVVRVAGKAASSPKHVVRAANTWFWRCIVWSLVGFRQYAEKYDNDPKKRIPDWKSRWMKGIGVAQQEVKDGAGAALVYCILTFPPLKNDDDASAMDVDNNSCAAPWMVVLKGMVDNSLLSTHREGVALLSHLLGAIGSSAADKHTRGDGTLDPYKVLHEEFFDGTLLTVDGLSRVGPRAFDTSCIRYLTVDEIEAQWDELMNLWEIGLERTLKGGKPSSLSDDLISVWHALLLSNSELTQQLGHLSLPQPSTLRGVSIIVGLFARNHSDHESYIRLSVAKQLWTVMKNAFASEWLTDAASGILGSIFKANYCASEDDNVRTAWCNICNELISVAGPEQLSHILSAESNVLVHLEIKSTWAALAKIWSVDPQKHGWELTISFLGIATRHWKLTKNETELCVSLLPGVIVSAAAVSVSANAALEAIVERVLVPSTPFPAFLAPMLSHITLNTSDDFPLSLLIYFNKLIFSLYPQQEALYPMMDVFRALTAVIHNCSITHVLPFLSVMSEGLSLWIKDESSAILDDEYNDNVVPFYCECLTQLRTINHDAGTLRDLESFLCSAFNHVPSPALAPMACLEFWKAIRSDYSLDNDDCPERLQMYLQTTQDVCGDTVPLFDVEPDSQDVEESYNTVPDSQPGSPSVGDLSDFPDDFDHEDVPQRGGDTSSQAFWRNSSHSANAGAKSGQRHLRHSSVSSERIFDKSSSPVRREVALPPSAPSMPPIPDLEAPSSPVVARLPFTKRTREEEEDDPVLPSGVSRSSSISSELSPFAYRSAKRARKSPSVGDESGSVSARECSPEFPPPGDPNIVGPKKEPSLSPEISLPHELSRAGRNGTQSDDDYESWDRALTSPELRRVQKELSIRQSDTEDEEEVDESTHMQHLDPSASSSRGSRPTNDRSQSAPVPHTSPRPSKQRAQTTPALPRSSTHLQNVLDKLYETVRGSDEELPTAEILGAQRLLHEMNMYLNDKLMKKYESEGE